MIYEIKGTTAAFDTDHVVVGRSVCTLYIYDLVVFDDQVILTSGCTVRAGSTHTFYFPRTVIFSSLDGQGTGRAGLCTVTAGLTACLFPVLTKRCVNDCIFTGSAQFDRSSSGCNPASLYAALAVNTFGRIIGQERMCIFFRNITFQQASGSNVRSCIDILFITIFLKLAVTVFLAVKAVDIVIGKKQF